MKSDLMQHKDTIEQYLKGSSHQLSSFSFVNLFIWKEYFDFTFKVIHGNLCIFARHDLGSFVYLPPLGRWVTTNTIEKCFELMYKTNHGKGISRIENVEEADLKLFDEKKYSLFHKGNEYVYRRENIVSLKGNRLKSKRASYNHFIKNNVYQYLPFEPSMQKECESLYDVWAKTRKETHNDAVYQDMLKENRSAHKLAMVNHKKLNLVGRVVFLRDRIKAYTFGFKLTEDTFCILFEIADLTAKGLPTFIFREFCRDPQIEKFAWINVMDDFGLENIKKTKLSFRPFKIIPAYVVSKREE